MSSEWTRRQRPPSGPTDPWGHIRAVVKATQMEPSNAYRQRSDAANRRGAGRHPDATTPNSQPRGGQLEPVTIRRGARSVRSTRERPTPEAWLAIHALQEALGSNVATLHGHSRYHETSRRARGAPRLAGFSVCAGGHLDPRRSGEAMRAGSAGGQIRAPAPLRSRPIFGGLGGRGPAREKFY